MEKYVNIGSRITERTLGLKFQLGDFTVKTSIYASSDLNYLKRAPLLMIAANGHYRHRQFCPFERYSQTTIYTDNAHYCLAGISITNTGLLVFHDGPNTIFNHPIKYHVPRKTKIIGTIFGGGLDYWEEAQATYHDELGHTDCIYIYKPEGYERSEHYSFVYAVLPGKREIECGYYYNPKGPSGDGWRWDD